MRHGFTMAEALITVGIIGIIAAITFPILIKNYNKQKNVVVLRKAYSDIQKLFLDFQADTNCYDNLNYCFPKDGQFRDEFAKYLYIKKGFQDKFSKDTQIELKLLNQKKVENQFWLIKYSPVNSEGTGNKILIAPGGAYILGFSLNGRDNFYQLYENGKSSNPPNYFRAKIEIYTDPGKVNDFRSKKGKRCSIIGRDIFYLFIMSDGQIIPNGTTKCGGKSNYECGDVNKKPSLCDPTNITTQNLSNGTYCFGKIIGDGWQMKY